MFFWILMLSEVATSGSNGRRFDVLNATSVSWVVEICHQWQSCSLGYVEIRRILERKNAGNFVHTSIWGTHNNKQKTHISIRDSSRLHLFCVVMGFSRSVPILCFQPKIFHLQPPHLFLCFFSGEIPSKKRSPPEWRCWEWTFRSLGQL